MSQENQKNHKLEEIITKYEEHMDWCKKQHEKQDIKDNWQHILFLMSEMLKALWLRLQQGQRVRLYDDICVAFFHLPQNQVFFSSKTQSPIDVKDFYGSALSQDYQPSQQEIQNQFGS